MTTDIQVRDAVTGTVLSRREVAALEFSDAQRQLIRDAYAKGASDVEFAVLMEIARARALNPLLRQVFFVSRWDSKLRRETWATQVSIDGLRAIAERTGLYAGQDKPAFTYKPDGSILCCEVAVYRKDWARPAVGLAYFDEYVQTTTDKETKKTGPSKFWKQMPHVMIAKCSESLALRKAFPEDTANLYTAEEMGQADNDAPPHRERLEGDVEEKRLPATNASTNTPDPLTAYRARLAAAHDVNELVAVVLALAPTVAAHHDAAWAAAQSRAADLGEQDLGAAVSGAGAITKEPGTWTTVAAALAGIAAAATGDDVAAVVKLHAAAVTALPAQLKAAVTNARRARLAMLLPLADRFERSLRAAETIPALDALAVRMETAAREQALTAEDCTRLTELYNARVAELEAPASEAA